jgi:hypothetical protein
MIHPGLNLSVVDHLLKPVSPITPRPPSQRTQGGGNEMAKWGRLKQDSPIIVSHFAHILED